MHKNTRLFGLAGGFFFMAAATQLMGCPGKDTDSKETGATDDTSVDDTEDSDTGELPVVWESERIETSVTLNGVHVSADGATYVAGTDGHMWKYTEDLGWSSINVEVDDEDLNGIWGPAKSSGWVSVGNAGWIVRFDGAQNNIEDLGTSSFLDVHGSSMSNIYAISWAGPYRFDGTSWEHETLPGSEQLNAVYVTENTTFGVGEGGDILWRTAGEWLVMDSGTNKALNDVSGTGDNDVWAVGEEGTILHFDGKSWSLSDSPTDYSLYGVWAASPTAVFAVGINGMALMYDGTSWAQIATGVDTMFYGVHGTAANNVWAVGNKGGVMRFTGM